MYVRENLTKGIIIGKGGSMLKRIGIEARKEIESMMDTQVNLQLWVKVRKEWRDSELYMKNYGYNQKNLRKNLTLMLITVGFTTPTVEKPQGFDKGLMEMLRGGRNWK